MTDPTPRLRKLRATGGTIVYHPCEVCGDLDAPYGYEVQRVSRGRWVKDAANPKADPVWRGQTPLIDWGSWRCREHRK